MKKLVKPVENFNLEENAVETLCGEFDKSGCWVLYCWPSFSADSETENDIIF